jgi:hypothetical protein
MCPDCGILYEQFPTIWSDKAIIFQAQIVAHLSDSLRLHQNEDENHG